MKRILTLILPVTAALALLAPVHAFAQTPTPTPKGGKGGGPPAGKPQFNQQPVVHQPVVTRTPVVSRTPFAKPVVHSNAVVATPTPKVTGGTSKPLYHKPVVNGGSTPAANPAIVNQTNTNPKYKKGTGGKPTGNPPVVNNTTVVNNNTHITPKLKQSKSWAGPQSKGGGGGGQQFNQANNYGGHWVSADTHSDWSHSGEHDWNGHHFRWFNGGWLNIDNGFWPQGYYNYTNGPSKIYDAQAELADMGYYNGTVDGVPGPMTRQAIADFQGDNGLPVDGHLNPPTQDALGL